MAGRAIGEPKKWENPVFTTIFGMYTDCTHRLMMSGLIGDPMSLIGRVKRVETRFRENG